MFRKVSVEILAEGVGADWEEARKKANERSQILSQSHPGEELIILYREIDIWTIAWYVVLCKKD